MRYMAMLTALLALAGFARPALAQDCGALPTNLEIQDCLRDSYQRADAELNQVWKQVLASIDRSDYMSAENRAAWKDEMTKAQRAWITFKEHDCDGAVGFEWYRGSGAGGAVAVCMTEHTRARTEDLRSRYLNH